MNSKTKKITTPRQRKMNQLRLLHQRSGLRAYRTQRDGTAARIECDVLAHMILTLEEVSQS